MITSIKRTNSQDQDFIELVNKLDTELAVRDGDAHSFYHQFNSISMIKYAVVVYKDNIPVGCGAIKVFDVSTMEVKRMYVSPAYREQGISRKILAELETWTVELGYGKCVLETGINQPEALALYHNCGFRRIPNYGQYARVENSFCFEKVLKP